MYRRVSRDHAPSSSEDPDTVDELRIVELTAIILLLPVTLLMLLAAMVLLTFAFVAIWKTLARIFRPSSADGVLCSAAGIVRHVVDRGHPPRAHPWHTRGTPIMWYPFLDTLYHVRWISMGVRKYTEQSEETTTTITTRYGHCLGTPILCVGTCSIRCLLYKVFTVDQRTRAILDRDLAFENDEVRAKAHLLAAMADM